jgi:CRISPR/Cas system-associated exonuclease Cas4 (RecB family)
MMEPDYIMKRFDEIATEMAGKKEGELRFGAKFISVSEVATQYFCEKKVEMERRYGREETPEMRIGKEAHELLLKDAVKVERRQILQRIYSGKPLMLGEMILLGKHKDVIIAGLADAVFFCERHPRLLLEYKFSSRQVPFKDHHVQARLYCYLLNLMGWDTSRLKYALVLAPRELTDEAHLRKIPLEVLKQSKLDKFKIKVEKGDVNVYVNSFNIEEAVKELEWAIDFWKQKREAVPTRKPAKCLSCEYREKCGQGKE